MTELLRAKHVRECDSGCDDEQIGLRKERQLEVGTHVVKLAKLRPLL